MASVSVIIPFHRNLDFLERSVRAVRIALDRAAPNGELLVVADGAPEDCSALVAAAGGRTLAIPGPSGPAVARNRAAAAVTGDVLVFVDSDVVVAPDAIARIVALLRAEPDVDAVFGAYDEEPADPGFHSQARNLAHSFVHQRSAREASTFWAGLGAIRSAAFHTVGGFDERFGRPSVEDIDLGYRLREAGCRIVLEHGIRGKHLKRWSLWSGFRSDLRDRGIPWTQLLHRYAAMRNDMNVSHAYRLCVVFAYLAVALLVAGLFYWPLWIAAAVCLLALVALDRPYYAFFVKQRGFLFTLRWFPVHVLHHLTNGVSFVVGTLLYWSQRIGVEAPGALPVSGWKPRRRPGGVHAV